MIFLIISYWVFSTLLVGLSILSEEDSLEIGIIAGCVSVFFGWLILPVACVLYIFELFKKKFYENK